MIYVGILISGMILTALFVYPTMAFAHWIGAIDQPGGRSIHKKPTPLLGGLAILCASIVISLIAVSAFQKTPTIQTLLKFKPRLIGMLLGAFAIVLLGIWDDRFNLSARTKLLGQVMIATMLVGFGFTVRAVGIPTFGILYLGPAGPLFFILWVVAITNAINLIDGIDGLASTACFFTALGNGLIAVFYTDNVFAGFFCFLLAGCLLGFLLHNFPPAKIFLGDTGSMLIGFILAVVVVEGNMQKRTTALMLAAPFLLLGLSLLDVFISIIRRFIRGKPIFSSDVGHIHHRLMFHLKNPRRVLLVLATYCCLLMFTAIGINQHSYGEPLFWVATVSMVFFTVIFIRLLGYFRVRELTEAFERRSEVKFLYSLSTYMERRLPRARSFQELMTNLELVYRDLDFVRLEIRDSKNRLFYRRQTGSFDGEENGVFSEDEEFGEEGRQLMASWCYLEQGEDQMNNDTRLVWKQFMRAFWKQYNHLEIEYGSRNNNPQDHVGVSFPSETTFSSDYIPTNPEFDS